MTLTSKFSTKQRVLLSLIFVVCVVVISLAGLNSMRASTETPARVNQEHQAPGVLIAKMLELASQNRTLALTAVQHDPRNSEAQFIVEPFSSLRPQVERNLNELNEIQQAYLARSLTDQEQRQINNVIASHQAFLDTGVNAVFDAVESDNFDNAKQAFYRQLEPAFARYREEIAALERLQPNEVAQK
ncbi:MAG: Tar ligand binding domain-containing protein [Pseudomonas sp.]|nr:Tar ligand binding domain-containing protein [Pseudomonas sp.]